MHGRAAVWHSYLRLLQMGFTKLRCCQRTGALLPHRFSFSPASRGVFFSVALSVGLPRPAVSWHLALRSPDFPHARARDCPARSRLYYTLSYEQCIELTLRPSRAPYLFLANALDGRSPPGARSRENLRHRACPRCLIWAWEFQNLNVMFPRRLVFSSSFLLLWVGRTLEFFRPERTLNETLFVSGGCAFCP